MKKGVIILIVLLVILAAGGLGYYFYGIHTKAASPTNLNSAQNGNVEIQAGGITSQPTSGQGNLSVCSYQCGDGVCQTSDPNCKPGDISCICPETHQDCPEDCK